MPLLRGIDMCKGQGIQLTMGERCVVFDNYGWIVNFPLQSSKRCSSWKLVVQER